MPIMCLLWCADVIIMRQSCETHWRKPGVFTFTVSEMQWIKIIQSELPRPLNIKHNSLHFS